MERQNMMRSEEWPNRLRLMRAISQREASAMLLRATTSIMKESVEKEETALTLAEIVEQDKLEEAVLAELDALQDIECVEEEK